MMKLHESADSFERIVVDQRAKGYSPPVRFFDEWQLEIPSDSGAKASEPQQAQPYYGMDLDATPATEVEATPLFDCPPLEAGSLLSGDFELNDVNDVPDLVFNDFELYPPEETQFNGNSAVTVPADDKNGKSPSGSSNAYGHVADARRDSEMSLTGVTHGVSPQNQFTFSFPDTDSMTPRVPVAGTTTVKRSRPQSSEEKAQLKRARNTEAARRSRARKNERLNELETKCKHLTERNKELELEVLRLKLLMAKFQDVNSPQNFKTLLSNHNSVLSSNSLGALNDSIDTNASYVKQEP